MTSTHLHKYLRTQQSAVVSQCELPVEKSSLQLFSPQINSPWQSSYTSQSPPPIPQGVELEQHPQLVLDTPSHAAARIYWVFVLLPAA